MFQNYLKIAWRNLLQQKGFSFINIFGLTIGLTCCFLILLFVRHELSYDKFHAKHDRIYRISYLPKFAGLTEPLALTPPPVSPLLASTFSEVETSARMFRSPATVEVRTNPQSAPVKFDEERFFFGDPAILNIFSFRFLKGDPNTALRDKFSVIVSRKAAQRYFGNTDPIGKTLTYEGRHPMTITGVIDDFPDNSHIYPEMVSNYETMFATENEAARKNLPYNFVISHSYTYVLLRPGRSPESVNARFPAFLKAHADKEIASGIEYKLEPMRDFHLRSTAQNTPEPAGSMTYVYIFMGIAGITLMIACINFINLSTARSLRRAKEVGIRKVLGSARKQLIGQFLGESMLLSFFALLLSLVLISVLLPVLNTLTNKQLTLNYLLQDRWLLPSFIGIAVLSGVLSGVYPAFFVSGFQPIATLKGSFSSAKAKGGILREALLGIQLVASICLIIGALVTFQQLAFLRDQPLGFDKDFIITVNTRNQKITNVFTTASDSSYQRLKTFREVLLRNPQVQDVTLSNAPLGSGGVHRNVVPEGYTQKENLMFTAILAVDHNFAETYGLKLVAGRHFSEAYTTDKSAAFLINEAAVKQYGWKTPSAAIGKGLNVEGKQGKIIGVLKDFHNRSLYAPIDGLVMSISQPELNVFSIKLRPKQVEQTIGFIRQQWDQFFPEKSFDYAFLDQDLARQYDRDQRLSQLISYFAIMTILISCMGLFGLVSLATQQKTKEIGIRKVLGASVPGLVAMLSKGYVRLVLLAMAVASPLAWWGMNKWLQTFAYKVDVAWWVFALAGMLTLFITLITVSFQSVKAALINPVRSLRSE